MHGGGKPVANGCHGGEQLPVVVDSEQVYKVGVWVSMGLIPVTGQAAQLDSAPEEEIWDLTEISVDDHQRTTRIYRGMSDNGRIQ